MKNIILILFPFLSFVAYGQNMLDSAKVYMDFELHGRTTAGAYSHFDDLRTTGCLVITISKESLEELNSILSACEIKKHRQTKLGINNIYMLGYNKGIEQKIIIASEGLIINLSKYKEYRPSEFNTERLTHLTNTWKM